MLEAGGMWDSAKDSRMSAWSYDSPRRGASTAARPFGEFDGCNGGWDLDGEPYTQAAGSQFDWFRGRMLGGRTNHWGRISLRMGPDDFRRRSLDGIGDDWPITYDDMKPYYDKLDRLVGIFGSGRDPERAGRHVHAGAEPRCYELLTSRRPKAEDHLHSEPTVDPHEAAERARRRATTADSAAAAARRTRTSRRRQSCCRRPWATGKLRMITNAMAREVLTARAGLASGVSYMNRSGPCATTRSARGLSCSPE